MPEPPEDSGPVAGAEGPAPPPAGWRRLSTLRIGAVAAVAAVVVSAWMLTRSPPAGYRTALVRTATVKATLDSVGSIAPVNQADLAFGTSGTVGSVDVSVGSTVTAGQMLAALDPTQLNASVVSAEAALAAAQATLASAKASQSAPASSPSASSASSAPAMAAPPASSATRSGGSSPDAQQIAALQATLVADQSEEDADSSAASQSLATATSACQPAATGGSTSPPGSTSPAGSAPPAGSASSGPPAPGGGAPADCGQALAQASAAQARLAADIKRVTHDESVLDAALQSSAPGGSAAGTGAPAATPAATASFALRAPAAAATDVASAGEAPSGSSTALATTGGSGSSGSSGSSSGGAHSGAASAQQLALDQAAIDTAQARLSDAQVALQGLNLVSTISGTVASVSIAAGDTVAPSAGAADPEIVVVGPGSSYQLVTEVPVADIGEVTVGQAASVVPDATNTRLDGTVTSIGLLPAASSSGTTTYPVTISLTSPGLGLFSGADAAATIVVARSEDVTAVPTSAVRTTGSVHLVTVVEGSTTRPARVTLGTVGDVLTQITSGLRPGQVVALADLAQPVPTTSTRVGRFGGLGGAPLARSALGGGAGGGFVVGG